MINEQKIAYRMKNLMESGFFGKSKSLLNEALADKDKVRIFQAAYNYTYNQNIAVDGVKGAQTTAAIEAVKKDLGKEKLDDTNMKDFYTKFFTKLTEEAANINVGEGGSNNNKILNYAIQALINLAGQPIGIDGVIGTKTITAIKALTNNESGAINNETLSSITPLAIKTNVQSGLSVEDVTAAKTKTREEITAESRETWKKYPCITQADGIKENVLDDGTISYTDKNDTYIYFGNGRRMDVGVDGNGMNPYNIDEIIRIMNKRLVGSDMSGDHHLDDLVGVVG
jgi:lysozyme family protein